MRSLVLGIQSFEKEAVIMTKHQDLKCGEHKYPKLTKPAHVENEYLFQCCVRDGPLGNLLGGGGRSKKNIRASRSGAREN